MTGMIDETATEAAARAMHEKYRTLHSIEQVPWDELMPIAKEAAIEDARLVVEAYEAAQASLAMEPPDVERVTVGRYLLERFPQEPKTIHITCNAKSDACGEGGSFSERLLEEAISKFYGEHF